MCHEVWWPPRLRYAICHPGPRAPTWAAPSAGQRTYSARRWSSTRFAAEDLSGPLDQAAGEAPVGPDLPDPRVVESGPQQRPFRAVAVLSARRDDVDGQECDAMVEMVDVLPTVLDLAGVPAPHRRFGRSLLPLLRARPSPSGTRSGRTCGGCTSSPSCTTARGPARAHQPRGPSRTRRRGRAPARRGAALAGGDLRRHPDPDPRRPDVALPAPAAVARS